MNKKLKNFIILIISFIIIFLVVYMFALFRNYLKYSSYIEESARDFNVDPVLIVSIIKTESNFNEKAESKKGAIGLMQLMPNTAKDIAGRTLKYNKFNVSDFCVPQINIYIGTAYLCDLDMMLNNNRNLVLAAYNAGIGNLQQWYKQDKLDVYVEDKILFKETKQYVKKVNRNYKIYKFIFKIYESYKFLISWFK